MVLKSLYLCAASTVSPQLVWWDLLPRRTKVFIVSLLKPPDKTKLLILNINETPRLQILARSFLHLCTHLSVLIKANNKLLK